MPSLHLNTIVYDGSGSRSSSGFWVHGKRFCSGWEINLNCIYEEIGNRVFERNRLILRRKKH
jgi:hypothetical protein